MGSINKHIIVGTVGKDPVLRVTQSGKSICEISVATNDGDRDNQGNSITNWHKVICFDKTAEFVAQYVAKGTLVCAEGPVKLRSFMGKEGNTVYVKETIAFKVEALSRSVNKKEPASYTPGSTPPMQAQNMNSMNDAFPNATPQGVGGPEPQGALPGQPAGQEHTAQAPAPQQEPPQPAPAGTDPFQPQSEDDLPF